MAFTRSESPCLVKRERLMLMCGSGQLRTFLIQVCIHANHQNGKDTHVRGLQIFSEEP